VIDPAREGPTVSKPVMHDCAKVMPRVHGMAKFVTKNRFHQILKNHSGVAPTSGCIQASSTRITQYLGEI
jgi:hypothetical protein